MHIEGSIALVTGANRGLGRHFARQLLERGAAKVYAGSRRIDAVDLPGVEPVQLDITDPASVAAAAAKAADTTILVNNAGIATFANLLEGDGAAVRSEMETNFFGTLNMVRAFAPVLGANGGGAVLNILSVLSWRAFGVGNAYAAAKAASWSLTNGARLELAAQGTQVTGLHVGGIDTDMLAAVEAEKADPADIARAGLDGIEAGALEVLADRNAVALKAILNADPSVLYPELAS
ncbi:MULTISPECIES: SDR family oxidoreductase [Glycomyces]|uniref:NAD(P)-dependent dehydrogenase (Short-subunit alcohol dehydrogenase family) n=2 Tax=Glycomyces TaxID=58113 RepID=A0A9X3T8V0_9ACTN|nr:SDR family oxidoreductase [Glycomyces lechevalierae]MDA1385678.1 SDR family oxidoreductase [Glycomyces lechevalierae]MDR7339797.1 NAD(P)-dependent dehydrogenase (short-subunit alcohol dehydrogenase family) [Glycomyces lechevalierae]